jgi:hypothetical protein
VSYDYTLADLRVGQTVRAFHPHTLGVTHHAIVEKIGRVYVTVRFTIDGKSYRLHPKYVTEVGF